MNKLKAIGLFVGVSLPSLLLVLLSADAPLVAGGDVFLFSLVQVIFIGVFIGFVYRKTSKVNKEGDPS